MMRLSTVVLVLAVGTALPAPVQAEESPLAAAARKEQERRDKVKGTGPVLTNDDLRVSGSTAAATPDESGTAEEGKAEGAPDKPAEKPAATSATDEREARRAAIQAEITAQTERIRAVRQQIVDIDRELADSTAVSEGPRRQQLAERRAEGAKFITETEARIGELQDEARKLGVTVNRPE